MVFNLQRYGFFGRAIFLIVHACVCQLHKIQRKEEYVNEIKYMSMLNENVE
jgi:hypothetical protein